jgi:hypothetical protein
MSCEEIQEILGAYRDGELDSDMRDRVDGELASCPACQAALRELEALSNLVHRAVIEPAASADLSGFADEVMARIAAETTPARAPATEDPSGFVQRFASMLGLDGRSLALAGALVAAALAWGLWPAAPIEAPIPSPSMESGTPSPSLAARPRRGMEMETALSGGNAASVQEVEVAHGRVVIDDNADDPDRPVVVWHILGDAVEHEADAAP